MQSSFWDKRASKYDDQVTRRGPEYIKTIDRTASLLTDADVVLDLGCASGQISIDLAPKVARVLGIDTSIDMVELANRKLRTRNVANVDFSRSDAFDTNLVERSFSAITAFNVFHLVQDLSAVLGRLYSLLKPGGLLISQTPCLRERKWIFRTLVGIAIKSGLAPSIRSLTFTELASLMVCSGFEIVDNELWDEKDAIQRIVARRPEYECSDLFKESRLTRPA